MRLLFPVKVSPTKVLYPRESLPRERSTTIHVVHVFSVHLQLPSTLTPMGSSPRDPPRPWDDAGLRPSPSERSLRVEGVGENTPGRLGNEGTRPEAFVPVKPLPRPPPTRHSFVLRSRHDPCLFFFCLVMGPRGRSGVGSSLSVPYLPTLSRSSTFFSTSPTPVKNLFEKV